MEDRILVTKFTLERHTYYIFLVLDGHGGHSVATYTQQNFVKYFKRYLKQQGVGDMKRVISNTFTYINEKVKGHKSGTTASLLLIVDDPRTIWLAHVGDSSVYGVQCKNVNTPKIHLLTTNHSVSIKRERKRIRQSEDHEAEEGYVTMESGDMLAVTRAIGDNDFGQVIKAEPTVKQMTDQYDVYMLCSDGIWDVMSGREVWKHLCPLYENGDWKYSAYAVNEYRNKKYEQHDNTSMILVYVDHNKYASGK